MRLLRSTALLAAGLAACLALAACNGSDSNDATASSSPAPTSDSAATQKLQAAATASDALAAQGSLTTTAIVQELVGTTIGQCMVIATQPLDGSGQAAQEYTQSVAGASADVGTICDTAEPMAHYFITGTEGYVEYPVGSGTYIQADLDQDVVDTASESSSIGDTLTALMSGTTATESADGTIELAVDSVDSLKNTPDNAGILETLGLNESMLASIDQLSVRYTVHIDPTTGAVDTLDSSTSVTAEGKSSASTSHMTIVWGLAEPITVPVSATNPAPIAVGTFEELLQLAVTGSVG